MAPKIDMAAAALQGDAEVVGRLAGKLILVERDNVVERPWGGDRIHRFKQLPEPGAGVRWGEVFEISAFDDDAEALQFPSYVTLEDGSRLSLPALLREQGNRILGQSFSARYGACFPLLPKMLSVRELLSVQGHPEGHTEVYIIIDAEPGASLRLGFNRDIDAAELGQILARGLSQQDELIGMLKPEADVGLLQQHLAPWFADRDAGLAQLQHRIGELIADDRGRSTDLLQELKSLYWQVLDSMNRIELAPGQVIHNATPSRLLAETGTAPSAEVHALGNPEQLELLALEIRRPGPTFRAWDNVRFPKRNVDVGSALDALNLRATRPEEYLVEPVPVAGQPGLSVSVDSEFFRIEHLNPEPGQPIQFAASEPHSLHCVSGTVQCFTAAGRELGALKGGESALVPIDVGDYRVETGSGAEVIRVSLPAS